MTPAFYWSCPSCTPCSRKRESPRAASDRLDVAERTPIVLAFYYCRVGDRPCACATNIPKPSAAKDYAYACSLICGICYDLLAIWWRYHHQADGTRGSWNKDKNLEGPFIIMISSPYCCQRHLQPTHKQAHRWAHHGGAPDSANSSIPLIVIPHNPILRKFR